MSEINLGVPMDSTRVRFHRVMKFQSVDRIPNCELGPWPETVQRWYTEEGMAMRLSTVPCWGGQPYFGLEPLYLWADTINKGLIPPFEEKIFEETETYIVKRHGNGVVRKSLKTGRSMDQYIDFPVKNRADFEAMKNRLDPEYKQIISHQKKKGVDIFMFTSDGNLELLLPQLIECGITANIPVEVAAGMDVVKLRKEYGKDMAWVGGIDKRCIAAGKEEIKRELETKLPYLVENGGCILMIDGDLAPDISLENFQYRHHSK